MYIKELIKFRLKRYLENISPYLYVQAAYYSIKLRGLKFMRASFSGSDLCIEGFPRCANTYSVAAIRNSVNNELCIATHLHSHANVLRAIKLKIPTLVVIRRPDEAIISLRALILESQVSNLNNNNLIPIELHIKWYIKFYSELLNKRDSFVLGDFEDVTTDFPSIVRKLNKKFSLNLEVIEDISEIVSKSTEGSKTHMLPSNKRSEIKRELMQDLNRNEVKELMDEAFSMYNSFIQN